ncbi:hypothetical protein, conserved [Eimeria praecox]|uniref:Uncharacterized protein n=1 Tax=Eimeria praecox TaxID=51316 RepID=U6GW51_9EIME|nr:hypothetical protein, conserved [Eimeria praecox]
MKGYSSNERFHHGLNPVSFSNPAPAEGNSEALPVRHAQTNPSGSGQLTEDPSSTAYSGAAARKRDAESGCKGQGGVTWPLMWATPKARPSYRSTSTVRGGTKSYRGGQAPPAAREGTKYEGSRVAARPSSVGASVRRSQVMASHCTQACSVNIPEQRRLSRHQQQTLQFKVQGGKNVKVPRHFVNAEGGPSLMDGPQSSASNSDAHPCTVSDSSAAPELHHLQKRRTWMLLQHLVDQLENEGRSDALLQRPELLQKLLHVIMPLVPLKAALGKFAANTKTASISRPQGSVGATHHSTAHGTRSPSARPVSTSFIRTVHASAPPSSADSHLRPTLLHHARHSPSRPPPISALHGVVQVPRGWSNDSPVTSEPSVQYPEGAADASRNASSRVPRDRDIRDASSTRARIVPKRDVGNTSGSGRLEGPLHWYDKPRPVRAPSTGKAYTHVASRLPQGALQHRRPLKTRSHAALVEKSIAERKQVRPADVEWASSPRHSNESVTDPVASARSEGSDATLKSSGTPSLGSASEDCPDFGFARQLTEDSRGREDWNTSRPQHPVRFSVTPDVEALPPSPRASNSDGEMPQSVRWGKSALATQGSLVAQEELQSVERGVQPPGLTKSPTPNSGARRRRLAEPRSTAARRHTVATTVASRQNSEEEDKSIRSLGGSLEAPLGSPEKRERRYTAVGTAKFKSTTAAIKGGRFVLTGEDADGGAKAQGMARVPLLKDIPKARDGRRATIQTVTPRNSSSFSRKLSSGAKRRMSPVLTKKIGKKGSKTFQKLSSISPRDLSPQSARGRRMSAPPPRRATQSKIAPAFSSRARNVADRSSPTRSPSASFKYAGRRKTVRLISPKEKGKTSNTQKDGESAKPQAEGTAQVEKKNELEEKDKNQEVPPEAEPDPEPPYPYLTLKELPPLDQPLRPLSHLCSLPFEDGPKSPPPFEDPITLMHVLDRTERFTQNARDEATQRAVSYLSNDSPGTMLLVARWLDSVTNAVESNTITASEKFPWREVVPPLFVGANRHRELLSSKVRSQSTPKDLRAFLETEGFIETQGQKLQHLLETKDIPTKPSEVSEGSPPPKPRTPLDNYLDYLLAVAVDSLRKRQRPIVIPKMTQHSFKIRDESVSSCCCDAYASNQTLESCQNEWMCRRQRRPDVVSSYYEHMASQHQRTSASVGVNSSKKPKETTHRPTASKGPMGKGSSPPSSHQQQGNSSCADGTFRKPMCECEAVSEEIKALAKGDCRPSSKSASPCPSTPLVSPSPPSVNRVFSGTSLKEKSTNACELPTEKEGKHFHTEESDRDDSAGSSHSQSDLTRSPGLPSNPKFRTKLSDRAAELQPSNVDDGLASSSPQPQRFSPTPAVGAKAKAKKQLVANGPVPRVALIGQKAAVGSKPLRPLGQAQWQTDSDKPMSPSQWRITGTVSRRPREHPVKKYAHVQSKASSAVGQHPLQLIVTLEMMMKDLSLKCASKVRL